MGRTVDTLHSGGPDRSTAPIGALLCENRSYYAALRLQHNDEDGHEPGCSE